jgi:phospholipase C
MGTTKMNIRIRRIQIRAVISLCFAAALLLTGCQGIGNSVAQATPTPTPVGTPTPPPGSLNTSINHIILFMQENRSFDHYFGALNAYRAKQNPPLSQDVDTWGPNKTPAGVSSPGFDAVTGGQGPPIPAFHMQSACSENATSSWDESHKIFNLNNGNNNLGPFLMNGAAFVQGHFARDEAAKGNNFVDLTGKRAMGFYDDSDLPFYYFIASNFATSDRWFSPVATRTQPNRIYWMAATSQGHIFAPDSQLPAKTIFQLMDEHNITWKIYEASGNTYFNFFSYSLTHHANVVPLTQYSTDLQNNTLPQVAYIETGVEVGETSTSAVDEHPDDNIQIGAQFAANLLTSLMKSASWKDSVFIQTYDEGGGFYDHVPPMTEVNPDGIAAILGPNDFSGIDNFTLSGFRVPMFVASPFSKKNFVSHTPMDFTAALKLIETRFNLPALTARDAAMPDMTEFFDFTTNTGPWATPPTPPVQKLTLPCVQGVPIG